MTHHHVNPTLMASRTLSAQQGDYPTGASFLAGEILLGVSLRKAGKFRGLALCSAASRLAGHIVLGVASSSNVQRNDICEYTLSSFGSG